jgi:hypothetical protein
MVHRITTNITFRIFLSIILAKGEGIMISMYVSKKHKGWRHGMDICTPPPMLVRHRYIGYMANRCVHSAITRIIYVKGNWRVSPALISNTSCTWVRQFIAWIIWFSWMKISTVLGILQLDEVATNIRPCCSLYQWYSTWGTRRHLRGYVKLKKMTLLYLLFNSLILLFLI